MAATQEKTSRSIANGTPTINPHKIDPNAPAGSEDSLGDESIRDGRPATDDCTVEAIDEAGPGIPAPPSCNQGS
jgi:hypothetical protein